MRRNIKKTALIIMLLLISGCTVQDVISKKDALNKVKANFSAGAITLHIQTATDLNMVNGLPSSCTILLLQASNKTVLNKILNNQNLTKGLFAGVGSEGELLQLDRYTLMPGQSNTLHINRASGTRSVALVAGYYPYPGREHIKYYEIPTDNQKIGWWKPKWLATLEPLNISMMLTRERITGVAFPRNPSKETIIQSVPEFEKDIKEGE